VFGVRPPQAPAEPRKPLPTSYLNGIRYFEGKPAGPQADITYLLVHGLGGSLDFWTAVAPTLATAARVVAIDMPWFGKSPGLPGGFSLDSISRHIIEFCRAVGLSRCVLVAHSLGSIVAYQIAANAPDIFERVILVNGTVLRAAEVTRRPSTAVRAPRLAFVVAIQFFVGTWRVPRPVANFLAHSYVARSVFLWPFVANPGHVDPDTLAAGIANTGGFAALRTLLVASETDYEGRLAAVQQPVDLIWGSRDRLISAEDIDRTRKLVHVGRTCRIDDCGHWPMIEKPRALLDFMLSV
jgi:pimeloyl-ACP methyl ester carboxylesterase